MSQHSKFFDHLKSAPMYVLPHHLISRLIFRLTRSESKAIVPGAIRLFSKIFKVDLQEARISDPESYPTFNAFFTRELKPGLRPVAEGNGILACPVDGTVSQAGHIDGNLLIQAKGHYYSLDALLAGQQSWVEKFKNGCFATLYLSPRDYHRIHMPCDAKLKAMTYVPGRLFSVAQHTVRSVPGLFARNERVIAYFDTEFGPMAMILVGAINVAAIETTWAGLITPPNGRHIRHENYGENIAFKKGDEMGRFNMGSTVILLTGFNISWDEHVDEGATTRMGQILAKAANDHDLINQGVQ